MESLNTGHTRQSRKTRNIWGIAKFDPKSNVFHYYLTCAFGGALASTNRWALNPIDVVKCNMQAHPSRYSTTSQAVRGLYKQYGIKGFLRGFGATALAYGTQTGVKYGMYEIFKDKISQCTENKSITYVTAAASAEIFATIIMCPSEACKVALQTNETVHRATNGRTLNAIGYLWHHREIYRFPFGSLGPLLCRQVPSTITNFYTFEAISQAIYQHILTKPRESYSNQIQLSVSLCSGYIAGILSAIVSHPADSVVSRLATATPKESQWQTIREIVATVGWRRLATAGLGARCLSVGTVVGAQWWIYDSFRKSMGLGTSGGGNGTN